MANINDDFNFEEFAVRAIEYIDSMRSHGRFGTKAQESRINAFYRILGLPSAIRVDPREDSNNRNTTQSKSTVNYPDKFNTGNIFENTELSYTKYEIDFNSRQISFSFPIDEVEIEDFLDTSNAHIKSSLKISSSDSNVGNSPPPPPRKRGLLFPMVVDGGLHVLPQNRRIASAFMSDKERKQGETYYARPLIETIIYMKFKGKYIIDSSKQIDVSTAFQAESLQALGGTALTTLEKSLKNITKILPQTSKNLGNLRKITGVDVIPTVANVAQQNLEIRQSEKVKGELDTRKEAIDSKIDTKKAILSLFEYNDTIGTSNSRSMLDSGLTSVLLSVVNPEEDSSTEKEKEEIEKKIERATVEVKKNARTLDLLFGTFSGISGVDILAVIIAMFRMSDGDLISLLNNDAKARLKAQRGGSIPSTTSVTVAIDKLQQEVEKVFDELSGLILPRKHREKAENIS